MIFLSPDDATFSTLHIYSTGAFIWSKKTLVTTVKISWILEFGFPCMRRLTSGETLKRMFTVLG